MRAVRLDVQSYPQLSVLAFAILISMDNPIPPVTPGAQKEKFVGLQVMTVAAVVLGLLLTIDFGLVLVSFLNSSSLFVLLRQATMAYLVFLPPFSFIIGLVTVLVWRVLKKDMSDEEEKRAYRSFAWGMYDMVIAALSGFFIVGFVLLALTHRPI